MESSYEVAHNDEAPSALPSLKTHYNSYFSNMSANLILSGASLALFLLSPSGVFFNYLPSSMTSNLRRPQIRSIENNQEIMESSIGSECNDWMNQLENEFKIFYSQLETERKEWLQGKDKEWEKWKQDVEIKWMHYNTTLDEEYESNTLNEASKWDESQWKDWIYTEGNKIMEKEWENWIHKNDKYLDELCLSEWVQWKKNKIMTWLTIESKCKEDACWSKWEETAWPKWLYKTDRDKWLEWKKRNRKERTEWVKWVHGKEYEYIDNEWAPWSKWKNNKYSEFEQLKETIIDRWINSKQWVMWNEQRKLLSFSRNVFNK
ncbi:tryptophan-rich antigen [Plasmodium ovale]|uniref:Tryptophan-rich antigen n=2 Tax=Plasmodium ovale TaxID=36330 RepID=A0A1C3KII8_PLAOA|nr:tryptophan-rich antigen [Plasmodium ovale]